MNGNAMNRSSAVEVELAMREALSKSDTAFQGIAPVLNHMLDESWPTIVTEESLAHVRGMARGLTEELSASGTQDAPINESGLEAFGQKLLGDSSLLQHCFTLAIEGQVMEQLAGDQAIERVLSPLLQELVGSENQTTAELAMSCIAAQSRFAQSHNRMRTQLAELPPLLFHSVLSKWQEFVAKHQPGMPIRAVEALRKQYDESATRVAIMERLVSTIGSGSRAALDLSHGGFSLFVTAVAKASSQPRDHSILACKELASPRLGLSLKAAGLELNEIEETLALLGDATLSVSGIGQILPDQAQSILNDTEAP